MEVYGQLIAAGFERRTTDPAGADLFVGRAWMRTDLATDQYRVWDGAQVEIFTDTQSAQTFQNKVISGANVSDFLEFDHQGSTPSNPAAGKSRIYPKTDGTFYTLDENGNEVPLGSGGGGSKNYFDDVDAEIDSTIGNWETDDGVGGSSAGLTLSLSAVAGELLAGANSLKLVKDAADRDGHFIKVLSKTIDPADRGRPNYGSFSFRPGTGYVNSDLIWEVYDVTNAAVLYSGKASDLELLNSKGRFNWVSYLQETTAQVEFRAKVNGSATNSFEAFFDEFKFGPAAVVSSPIVTEWQQYDLTIGADGGTAPTKSGSPDVDLAVWRRVGDTMEINYSYRHNGSPGTAGSTSLYTFSLPPGYQIDVDKLSETFGSGSQGVVGPFASSTTSQGIQAGYVQQINSTNLIAYSQDSTTNPTIVSSSFNPLSDNSVRYTFTARVPIVGWSSGAILSGNELSLVSPQVIANQATGTHTNSGGYDTVIFSNEQLDTHGIYNPANGEITFPDDGEYEVSSTVSFASNTTGQRFLRMYKGAAQDVLFPGAGNATVANPSTVGGTVRIQVQKDEIWTVRSYQNSGGNLGYEGSAINHHLSIKKVHDTTVIGAANDQQYFESEEQDLPALSWNSATPGGTVIKKYKWIQTGKKVDFYFWWDYDGAAASNTFVFFDLPSDLPIPATQNANSTQTSHAGSAHFGNGGSVGGPASCQILNSTGRVYVVFEDAGNANEVHGHLSYYID